MAVEAGTAGERVVALVAEDASLPPPPVTRVVALAALERVGAGAADEDVVAEAAGERVAVVPGDERDRAGERAARTRRRPCR